MGLSILDGAMTGKAPRPPLGIVYGSHGVGKSTFAASIPDVLILDCENGLGRLEGARTPYLSTWGEIEEWITALIVEPHQYRVVAIDTLDWMLRRVEEEVSGSNNKITATLNAAHGGFGKGNAQ